MTNFIAQKTLPDRTEMDGTYFSMRAIAGNMRAIKHQPDAIAELLAFISKAA